VKRPTYPMFQGECQALTLQSRSSSRPIESGRGPEGRMQCCLIGIEEHHRIAPPGPSGGWGSLMLDRLSWEWDLNSHGVRHQQGCGDNEESLPPDFYLAIPCGIVLNDNLDVKLYANSYSLVK
jgi:hypothetical protein